jgi:hypothetical protein
MEEEHSCDKLLTRMSRLEGKIDVLIETNKLHAVTCDHEREVMNTDIKAIEKKQSWILGVGTACVVAVSALISYFKDG